MKLRRIKIKVTLNNFIFVINICVNSKSLLIFLKHLYEYCGSFLKKLPQNSILHVIIFQNLVKYTIYDIGFSMILKNF